MEQVYDMLIEYAMKYKWISIALIVLLIWRVIKALANYFSFRMQQRKVVRHIKQILESRKEE